MRQIVAGVLALAVAAAFAAPTRAERVKYNKGRTWNITFEADTLGRLPANAVARGGAWSVEEDSTVPGERLLRQSEDDDGVAFHFVQFQKPLLEDVVASVRFRIASGEIDPTAGICFQLDAKGKNGYLVRVSGATGEVAFHYLIRGKRRDIRFVKVEPPAPGVWHTLAVRRQGIRLAVSYDGREVMRVREERYSMGTVGLWTEDDTRVDFTGFEVGVP